VVESWYLTDEQIVFWEKFYKNGLGEFLYENKISPEWLFGFENVWESRENPRSEVILAERALIPMWGGKDSLVTIETFQRNNFDFETVVFGKMDAIKTPMSDMIGVNNFATDVEYFSFLRWLYEIQITQLFSKLSRKYFDVFSSCNHNFKISKKWNQDTLWCKKCPKCLFVYAMLSAFLSSEDLMKIFWSDLYQDESLETTFRELLGLEWIKPFECVGEIEEVVLAMSMTVEKYQSDTLPYILQIFKTEVYDTMSESERQKSEKKLFKIYRADNIPEWIHHLEKKLHE